MQTGVPYIFFDEKTEELHSEFYHGAPQKKISLPLNTESIAGYCGTKKRVINIDNVSDDITKKYKGLKFNKSFDKINQYKTKSILCVPLLNDDKQLFGVISLINSLSPKGFSKKDQALLEAISRHAVISVKRLQRQELATVFSEIEQKNLTGKQKLFIIFFDLIGYTKLSESQGNEKMNKIIHAWEKDHIRLINEYGGIYVKSAGDEIMSIFGLDQMSVGQLVDTDFLGMKFDDNITLKKFITAKNSVSNHTNLKPFILDYTNWLFKNKDKLDKNTLKKAEKFIRSLWAENVIRFMYMAQKNMDRLNNFFFAKNMLTVIGQLFFKKNQEKRVTLFPVDFRFKNSITYSQILFFCSMFN